MFEDKPLPIGWQRKTVEELYNVIGGGTPSTTVPEYWVGEIPWISSADIHGIKDIRPRKKISEKAIKESATNVVPAGSIVVVTRVGLGKVALSEYPLCFSQDSQGLIAKSKNVLPEYAVYYLSQATQMFKYVGRGTTISGVTKKQLKELPFPLPPLHEQERIVAKIEELFTQLDAGVAALKRVQAGLKRYKASVLKAAVEGRLVPQDPSDEPAEEMLRRLGKKPLAGEDLPALPNGWCWVTTEFLADGSKHALKAGPFGSSLKKEYYVPKGYKIYGQEQVIRGDPFFGDYYIDENRFEKLKSNVVKPGDILISLVGTIGRVLILPESIEPGIINPRLVKLSLEKQLIDSNYFKIFMGTENARHFFSTVSHGETMEILNLSILRRLPIPLPPLKEQYRIISEVDKRLSVVAEIISMVEMTITRGSRLRQSILRQAFEGRL